MKLIASIAITLAFLCQRSYSLDVIKTKKDFFDFSRSVSNGMTYKNSTIILECDIDLFDEEYEPMGVSLDDNKESYFEGEFYGQGHTISNLNITSSDPSLGLFGYVYGGSVNDLVIDKSCTITAINNHGGYIYVGGLIGTMYSYNSPITVQNIVNMANIFACGNIMYVTGGILGDLYTDENGLEVMNCVNMGNIYYNGVGEHLKDYSRAFVGGIIGYIEGGVDTVFVVNCLNLGNKYYTSVFPSTIEGQVLLGGIAGYAYQGTFHNCVNLGISVVNIDEPNSTTVFNGEILGYYYLIGFLNCFFELKTYDYKIDVDGFYGYYFDEGIDESLVSVLNEFSNDNAFYSYSKWVLNTKEKNMTFLTQNTSNSTRKFVVLNSKLILLPQISNRENKRFYGWHTDNDFNSLFEEQVIDQDKELYGKYAVCDEKYTLTLIIEEGNIITITKKFGKTEDLKQYSSKKGKDIGLWKFQINGRESSDTAEWIFKMPAFNVTLKAVLVITEIKTPEDFKKFSEDVNSGISYSEKTVTLENDIDMNGTIINITGYTKKFFEGTFDGKGHVIRNLFLDSTETDSRYVGLFGRSDKGMTVRNLVLDSNCTIYGKYSADFNDYEFDTTNVFNGGFIGYCNSDEKECILENSVNMGKIAFRGDDKKIRLYIGGLVGNFKANNNACSIRNSMFLGTIQNYGDCTIGYIGGIMGSFSGNQITDRNIIENCLNNGKIYNNQDYIEQEGPKYFIGGIVGNFETNVVIQNCVNNGVLENDGIENITIGQIAGKGNNSIIKNCYWEEDLGLSACGDEGEEVSINSSSPFNNKYELNNTVYVGSYAGYSLIDALNSYALSETYPSIWVVNEDEALTNFIVDNIITFSTKSKLILLPIFSSSDDTLFNGWYEDSRISTLFTKSGITNGTDLYGIWVDSSKKYTVTFMNDGKVIREVRIKPDNLNKNLKEVKKKGFIFVGWKDEYGRRVDYEYTMPKRDLVLKATWLKKELRTKEDLKEFSDAVNSGYNCLEKTIELKADIDMAGVTDFNPIGTDIHPFSGTFEGNGHRIKNLIIASSAQYTGLFGFTKETIIRNLILDESCYIESIYSYESGSLGGIIGYCSTRTGTWSSSYCIIVNVISYATVSFSEKSEAGDMNIGGIIGNCQVSEGLCTILNCANYGHILKKGKTNMIKIGGIAGRCKGYADDEPCVIINNLNYGKILHIGETNDKSELNIGGIIGVCEEKTGIHSCVNGGEIDVGNTRVSTIGSITGKTLDGCISNENFWFKSLNYGDNGNKTHKIGDDMTMEEWESVTSILSELKGPFYKSLQLINIYINALSHVHYILKDYRTTWIINPLNKEVTAKIDDKEDKFDISYNSSIVLLPTVSKGSGDAFHECHFDGWHEGNNKNVESKVVYEDTTFNGKWVVESITWIFVLIIMIFVILGIIVIVVIVGLIVAASLYIKGYKKRRDDKKKLRDLLYPKEFDEQEPEDSLNRIEELYSEDYINHGEIKMKEALRIAGLSEKLASEVMSKCYDNARMLGEENKLPKNITVDDAAALAMYTFDFGTKELYSYNPYRIINSALSERNEESLEKAKDLLYLVMKSLRKLPVVFGVNLHRGIRADVIATANAKQSAQQEAYDPSQARMGQNTNKSSSTYADGSIITWNALSSTTPDMNVTKTFLAGGVKAGNAAGTLFIIENGWGYDIQPYSLFPTETEILVEPERQLKVISTVKGELTLIKLEMLKTPIVLPDVFGKHDLKVSPIYFVKEKVDEHERKKRNKMIEEQNNRRKSMPPPPKDRKNLELDEMDMI